MTATRGRSYYRRCGSRTCRAGKAFPHTDRHHNRSAEAHRKTVCHRGGKTRQPGRRAAGGTKRADRSADAVALRLDTGADKGAVSAPGYNEGVRVLAETMGRAQPVLQQRLAITSRRTRCVVLPWVEKTDCSPVHMRVGKGQLYCTH